MPKVQGGGVQRSQKTKVGVSREQRKPYPKENVRVMMKPDSSTYRIKIRPSKSKDRSSRPGRVITATRRRK